MADQQPTPARKPRKHNRNKQPSELVDEIQSKKAIAAEAAREARLSLNSTRKSEKQTDQVLKRIEKDASSKVEALQKNVEATANRAKDSIDAAFKDVDAVRDDTRKSYNRFKRTYEAALNNEKTGIIARREDISTRHEKIKETQGIVTSLSKTAHERAEEIKAAHFKVTRDQDKISGVRDRAEEIKTEIEKTFHITTDTTMRGAFTERKNEIQTTMKFWIVVLIVSAVILIGAIAYLLMHQNSGNFMDTLATRLVYVTPLLLLIALAYRQYNHERRILEEYAFKAVMAQTLRNYAVLLSENYKDADKAPDKILAFLLSSMDNIYDRSVLDSNSGFFYQLILGNKKLGAQATLEEGTSKTTEIKSEKTVKTKARAE